MARQSDKSDASDRSKDGSGGSKESSTEGTGGRIEQLHETVGNNAVRRLHETGELGTNLSISQPGDEHEREADRVAERLVGGSAPGRGDVGRDRDRVSRKTTGGDGSTATGDAAEKVESVKGGGQKLASSTRSFFEPRFDRDSRRLGVGRDPRPRRTPTASGIT